MTMYMGMMLAFGIRPLPFFPAQSLLGARLCLFEKGEAEWPN